MALVIHGGLFVLLLLLLKTLQTQQQQTLCTQSYDLRTSDSCLYSSQDNYTLCRTDLANYLEGFNAIIEDSNCLNISLEAGAYKLSKGVILTYNILYFEHGQSKCDNFLFRRQL